MLDHHAEHAVSSPTSKHFRVIASRTQRKEKFRFDNSQTCLTGIIVNKGNVPAPRCNGQGSTQAARAKHGTNITITKIGNPTAAIHHGKNQSIAARHGQIPGAIHLQYKNQITHHRRFQFISHAVAGAMIHGWLHHIIIPAFHHIFMEMSGTLTCI